MSRTIPLRRVTIERRHRDEHAVLFGLYASGPGNVKGGVPSVNVILRQDKRPGRATRMFASGLLDSCRDWNKQRFMDRVGRRMRNTAAAADDNSPRTCVRPFDNERLARSRDLPLCCKRTA